MISAISLSLVSVIGSVSVGQLFGDKDNVRIATDQLSIGPNATHLEYIDIPWQVNNQGWYDITNFTIRYNVSLHTPLPGNDSTQFDRYLSYNQQQAYGNLLGRHQSNGTLHLEFTGTVPRQSEWVGNQYVMILDLAVTGRYSLGLVRFTVGFTTNLTNPLQYVGGL